MQGHEERVIAEKEELGKKLSKLIDFMHTMTFSNLTAIEQGLLMTQQLAMENYSAILGRRIELF